MLMKLFKVVEPLHGDIFTLSVVVTLTQGNGKPLRVEASSAAVDHNDFRWNRHRGR